MANNVFFSNYYLNFFTHKQAHTDMHMRPHAQKNMRNFWVFFCYCVVFLPWNRSLKVIDL